MVINRTHSAVMLPGEPRTGVVGTLIVCELRGIGECGVELSDRTLDASGSLSDEEPFLPFRRENARLNELRNWSSKQYMHNRLVNCDNSSLASQRSDHSYLESHDDWCIFEKATFCKLDLDSQL